MSLLDPKELRKHIAQGWRFVIAGGTGAFIDLGTLRILVHYFDVSPYLAVYPSTFLSVIFVFFFNRFVTFKGGEQKMGGQLAKFALVYGIAIAMNVATTSFFMWIGVHYLIARCLAIGIGMIWNYLMSHYFVFKKNEPLPIEVF